MNSEKQKPPTDTLCITPPPIKSSTNAAADLDGYILTGTTSHGRHFTPPSIARLTARFAGPFKPEQHIHDPTCGSAAMLVHAYHLAQNDLNDNATPQSLRITGQELNHSAVKTAETTAQTLGLDFDIRQGDTLTNPQFTTEDGQLISVDRVIANIPFSVDWDHGAALPDPHDRFDWTNSPPPESRADFAFLQHIISQLGERGRAAVIVPHSLLHRKADKRFREYIVENRLLDAVVDLPTGVFPDTNTKVSIMVLDTGTDHQHPENIFMAMLTDEECVEVDGRLVIPDEVQNTLLEAYWEHTQSSHTASTENESDIPTRTPSTNNEAHNDATTEKAAQANNPPAENTTLDNWT
ncbi:HsdM family class I SAM-dependent methyltransferase [Salinibaculum rarum]|uniref:HsdM family class I SAM-dependent methyltransferase n=1 Tax=Salinibaculum rarum TaxID=3058903 RepID=UPI00265DA80B|nr:N-6 DNA methylase [Salinibaculum sp. KK48]